MKLRITHSRRASGSPAGLASATSFVFALASALAGCGGGSGDSSVAPPATATPSTTNVSLTVVDGAIKNALVCLDKNLNGVCDSSETQGRTADNGSVTLAVPNADVGKYPVIAVVGTDAVDADTGAVKTAYSMSTPADQTGVVSPLTTLVQQTVASTGASSADAAKAVQDATGISASLFADYTKVAAPTDGSINAAAVARMLVLTTQQQSAAIAAVLGTKAGDGTTITQADLDKAIKNKLLELLPTLVAALSDASVVGKTGDALQAALLAAANTIVASDAALKPAALATVVAINNQNATAAPATAAAPAVSAQLVNLSFASPTGYSLRLFTGSLAQNTADANNNIRYVDRRVRASGSGAAALAQWGSGGDPSRGADLNWNGSAWVGCPINFENVGSVRDALGNSSYTYCDKRETGRSNRASFDIGDKAMTDVYAQIRAAGYTNQFIADTAVLGTAKFPAGSLLYYQTTTPLTMAISYYPAGANSPAGTSNVVAQYSTAVAAGGNAATQAAGTGCNTLALDAKGAPTTTLESDTNGQSSTRLESLIAAKTGTPCVFSATSSFSYNGATYTSTDANAGWGIATLSLGKIGNAAVGSGAAPGFYSGNTLLRVAFTGGSANPNAVTYYSCKERFNSGSTRACTPIGTGTYAITTLGDARVLSFSKLPLETTPLGYTRVFVERGGFVYFGYQNKLNLTNSARFNTVAAGALLAQLGLPAVDPSTPFTLTGGSYAGTWDVRNSTDAVAANAGTTVFIGANGNTSCQNNALATVNACTLTITNAATGAFTFVNGTSTATGTFAFQAGSVSGSYSDPTTTPASGSFVGGRR